MLFFYGIKLNNFKNILIKKEDWLVVLIRFGMLMILSLYPNDIVDDYVKIKDWYNTNKCDLNCNAKLIVIYKRKIVLLALKSL